MLRNTEEEITMSAEQGYSNKSHENALEDIVHASKKLLG
jgi:hypothetical protein